MADSEVPLIKISHQVGDETQQPQDPDSERTFQGKK
jgi:hypothetical protein